MMRTITMTTITGTKEMTLVRVATIMKKYVETNILATDLGGTG